MIKLAQKAKDYFARKDAERRAAYVARYAFNELQFHFLHREITHFKFKHQVEVALSYDSSLDDPLLSLLRTGSEKAVVWGEQRAREILTQANLREGEDFFVGSYINDEIIYFGVLMVQLRDPKWVMVLKLAF